MDDLQVNRSGKHATIIPYKHLDKLYVYNKDPESEPIYKGSPLCPTHDDRAPVQQPFQRELKTVPEQDRDEINRIIATTKSDNLRDSPWPPLEYLFNLKLGHGRHFVVAHNEMKPLTHYLIQKLTLPQLRRVENIVNEKFVNVLHFLALEKHCLVAWPFMPMSLLEVAQNRFLDDIKSASILGQVLEGLRYLHGKGFEHGCLSCSNVLINYDGKIKISGHEECRPLSGKGDNEGLIRLTMELVNGYYVEKSNVGFSDSEMFEKLPLTWGFLEALAKQMVSDLKALQEQPLFKLAWGPETLGGMLCYAQYFASWTAHCPANMEEL